MDLPSPYLPPEPPGGAIYGASVGLLAGAVRSAHLRSAGPLGKYTAVGCGASTAFQATQLAFATVRGTTGDAVDHIAAGATLGGLAGLSSGLLKGLGVGVPHTLPAMGVGALAGFLMYTDVNPLS